MADKEDEAGPIGSSALAPVTRGAGLERPHGPNRIIRAMVQDALQLAAQRSVDVEIGREFRDGEGLPLMVVIPPGKFLMGSPSNEERWSGYDGEEEPQHEVSIAHPLAVGKYPVTVGEFRRFVEATGHDAMANPKGWGGEMIEEFSSYEDHGWVNPFHEQEDTHPVTCVNWYDAVAFAAWIGKVTGGAYRLLSEAEWEYACRAGSRFPYAFGEELWDQANFNCEMELPTPAGSYPANAFQLHDMHGNVLEWCQDCWNDNYKGAPIDGSAWTTGDRHFRVLRGGCCFDPPEWVRSASRSKGNATLRDFLNGFRLARDL